MGKGAATKKPMKAPALDAKVQEEAKIADRKKELKAMAAADMKDLVKSLALEPGLKTEMIEAVLAHEAKNRDALRAQEAKRKAVLNGKKGELTSKSATELKELCEKNCL